jgi:trehalose/maltose hydrolase-like predicted phosphorylase
VNAWRFVYEGFAPGEEGRRETLCTLGNGYLATRGAAPESHADDVHYPGTYLAGCYNRLRDAVNSYTIENESLVNVPNWLMLTFRFDGGPWFDLANVDVLEHRQELDLQSGALIRMVRFRDGSGHTTRLAQRRFVHMEYQHLCGLQTTIVAEDWSGTVEVRSALDGSVENTGVERYRKLSSRHLRTLQAEATDAETLLLVTETTKSDIRIAEAARTRVLLDDHILDVERRVITEPDWVGQDLVIEVSENVAVTVDKVVAIFTSHDRAIFEPGTAAVSALARAPGFDELLARHAQAWARLWSRSRFEIGTEETLRVIRLHVFHLLQTVSEHCMDLDVGIPARGLHGEAYRGHILWDELFAFPILNLRLPLITRNLLLYRYRRLPEARWAARAEGYRGAMFPWQSGSDGREESQRIHVNPVSGRWVPDTTCLQRHIGIAVAYNVWQYYQATGDDIFLSHYGAEMILDIARFWGSIAAYDRGRDRYVIRGVIGPDEFHTGYPGETTPGLNNNAYTNIMAAWVLLRALEVLRLLPERRGAEIAEALGLEPEETRRWEEISRKLYVPFHDDGIISQFEGYGDLAELDWEDYRARFGDVRRLDRILEAEQDSPNRYKASKQADVLMLFYLLSADELGDLLTHMGYPWSPKMIPRTIEYYLARTTHGSTLSAVVHAWVLARAQRHRALDYFVEALRSDVADIQGGTTAEGIHLAAMAGSVDVLQRCFAGVEIRGDTLWLNPYWPAELGALEFTIRYRHHTLTLHVSGREVRVSAGAGAQSPIQLRCRDMTAVLGPGEAVEFPFVGPRAQPANHPGRASSGDPDGRKPDGQDPDGREPDRRAGRPGPKPLPSGRARGNRGK